MSQSAIQVRKTEEYRNSGKIKFIKVFSRQDQRILSFQKRISKVDNEEVLEFKLNKKIFQIQQSKLQQTYLINILKIYEDKQYAYIRMECCQRSLLDYIQKFKDEITINKIRKWFIQIMVAVMNLNKLGMSHRDIKLTNILVNDQQNIRLIDFGVSKQYQGNQMQSQVGYQDYRAPQITFGTYTNKIDIFSIGICLLFLSQKNKQLSQLKVKKQQLNTFQFSQSTPQSLCDLIRKTVQKEPENRINWLQLSQHKFFYENCTQRQKQLLEQCQQFYKPLYKLIYPIELTNSMRYLIQQITLAKDDFFTYQDSRKLPMVVRAKCLYFLLRQILEIKQKLNVTIPKQIYYYVKRPEQIYAKQYFFRFQNFEEYLTIFYLSNNLDSNTQLDELYTNYLDKIKLLKLAKQITKKRSQGSIDHFEKVINWFTIQLNEKKQSYYSSILDQEDNQEKNNIKSSQFKEQQEIGINETVLKV